MHNIQRGKITSAMVTRDYLPQYSAITTLLPTFTANYTGLQTVITQILGMISIQELGKTGITDSKRTLRSNLCVLAADCSRKLLVYATFNNIEVLVKEINFGLTQLKTMSDIDLRTTAQEIYERAQAYIAALTAYGITPASQTALLAAINAFTAAIPKPRLGIYERKQATQQLAALMLQMDMYLKNIDLAVEIVRLTQVNFYNGYVSSRKLIISGASKLAAKGTVVDADTGESIQGAIVSFMRIVTDANGAREVIMPPVVVKKTAAKGGFMVKSLPPDMYQLVVSKVGYPDYIDEVPISSDKTSKLKIKMQKKDPNKDANA